MMVHDLTLFVSWMLADFLSAFPRSIILILTPEFPVQVPWSLVQTIALLIGAGFAVSALAAALAVVALRGGRD